MLHHPNKLSRAVIAAVVFLIQATAPVRAAEVDGAIDIIALPIEQLVQAEPIPASRIARQISDAPSAVSIVTAQDIHDFGYRTLGDILKSMRGLYVTTSQEYDFLGGRGFGAPGDYAGRIMLMIDGYVTDDGAFNQIFLGRESLIDVGLIERVEYIPGPGSTSYGNSALLGVINIVTKGGHDIDGTKVGLSAGEHGAREGRITYGKILENGANILLSASTYRDHGRNIRFSNLDNFDTLFGEPYTNQTFNGINQNRNRRLFFKGHYQNWSLEAAHVHREYHDDAFMSNAGGLIPSNIGADGLYVNDSGFLSLKHDIELSSHLSASSHVYYGQGQVKMDYFDERLSPVKQRGMARWWGSDVKFIGTWFENHKLLFGGEYRDDYKQQFHDSSIEYDPIYGFDSSMRTTSLYAQDEYSVTDRLQIIPGFRYDHSNTLGGHFSPRLAFIYTPRQETTLKLSYGKAFRFANAWDRFRAQLRDAWEVEYKGDPYGSECVSTTELVWQQQLARQTRLTTSLYQSRIRDMILQDYDALDATGQEVGLEHIWDSGARLNASIALQKNVDSNGDRLVNSPHWLGKLNVVQPLFEHRLNAALEVQSIGRRLAANETMVDADTVVNLTFSSAHLLENADISLSIRNLLDAQQEDVTERFRLRTTPLDGRNLWLQLEYNFK